MINTIIRKMWFLILLILGGIAWFFLWGNYTSKELIKRYKTEISNYPIDYDIVIDDIKSMPIEVDNIGINCWIKESNALITNLDDNQWKTDYSLPSRFADFMKRHLYYVPGNIVCANNKKYIRFVFYNATEPLKPNGMSIRMFFCDNDDKEGLKINVYSGYSFKEIDDSSLDDVNDMKDNWIYKIKENWYVVGVHLKK